MMYRKKPVMREIMRFTDGAVSFGREDAYIQTLEGTMRASVGDYIVKGVDGEFYLCKLGIFEKTYEVVE